MSGSAAGAVVSGGRCSTCDAELAGSFCHQCGEPRSHHGDLALRHLLHDAVHEFTHVDGKIWRTVRALILEPGRLTTEYWEGRRGLWIRPFRLYLTIYILHLLLLPNVAGPLAFRFAAYRDANGKPHISVGTVAESRRSTRCSSTKCSTSASGRSTPRSRCLLASCSYCIAGVSGISALT